MDAVLVFSAYQEALHRMRLSNVRRGFGTTLMLEFGALTSRQGGRHRVGEITAMLPWGWRIERGPQIVYGTDSDEVPWDPICDSLIGTTVHDVSTFGRLPELSVALSDQYFITSHMLVEGDPCWALIDHRKEGRLPTVMVKDGRIAVE